MVKKRGKRPYETELNITFLMTTFSINFSSSFIQLRHYSFKQNWLIFSLFLSFIFQFYNIFSLFKEFFSLSKYSASRTWAPLNKSLVGSIKILLQIVGNQSGAFQNIIRKFQFIGQFFFSLSAVGNCSVRLCISFAAQKVERRKNNCNNGNQFHFMSSFKLVSLHPVQLFM